ncbi:uncharacterized protein [Apostichopus japonicus]|uniref:uncharacterized protein n=1 Tax=Stichopus japonicus TaxID=307972 RepID=UPI003AB87453
MTHVLVQWEKCRGISMLSQKDVLGTTDENFVGSKVSGRYNTKLLPATIIHIGTSEEMEVKLKEIQPVPGASINSPSLQGRGHRVHKRKEHPDFIEELQTDQTMLSSQSACSSKNTKNDASKKAKSAAGHEIIAQLLQQRDNTLYFGQGGRL